MRLSPSLRTFILLVIVTILSSCGSESDTPIENQQEDVVDLILHNARIYTFSWPAPSLEGEPHSQAPFSEGKWQPDAQAIAIKNGKIFAVGSNESILPLKSETTELIDLDGATLIPGLHDSHVHIAELGQILSRANLIDVESPQVAVEKLLQYTKQNPPEKGEWIIGQGWDEGAWANQYPDRLLLDKWFPDNPVVLKSLHGFAIWINSAAMQAAGIDENTRAPVGGEILKGSDGIPSGIFLNRATTLVQSKIPEPSAEEFERWISLGLQQMAKDGFVSIHQAGAEEKHIRAFQSLQQRGKLTLRVYAMLSARDKKLMSDWSKRGPLVDPEGWLDIRSVKAYYDGALGSRGARLLQDYSDKPGHKGVSGEGYGFNENIVVRMMENGFQVGIHAIGDAGNRETLDFLQTVFRNYPHTKQLRHRVEHAQVLHENDLPRLADLNLIASMEPQHAVEDKTWAEARLGPWRIAGAYAWRKLKKASTQITFNSDLPGSDHSIFYGLHSAVTRKDKNFQPEGGWYSQENFTIEEAVRAFTQGAAFAAFRENETGTIRVGNWADLTVLNIDIMQIGQDNPAALFSGEVLMTVINGEVVHQTGRLSQVP